MVSPVSTFCTCEALLPSFSCQDFSTRHFCGGLLGSLSVMSCSACCPWAQPGTVQASIPARAPIHNDRPMGLGLLSPLPCFRPGYRSGHVSLRLVSAVRESRD